MTTGSYTYDAALATNVEQRHNVVELDRQRDFAQEQLEEESLAAWR